MYSEFAFRIREVIQATKIQTALRAVHWFVLKIILFILLVYMKINEKWQAYFNFEHDL